MFEYHPDVMLRRAPIPLTDLATNLAATITRVTGAEPGLVERLHELGFLPGERVRVIAHGPLARDPLAVRVGDSTFALRRHEARCIEVDADGVTGGS
jgi:ferrous iron transport protein A